ncbi:MULTISPECIES: NUDIX hydrolase [Flammeovirga]|uniref:NUDIX hydrolase n=1 Tax=Flammeovirga agarivorans TaxID=2726742 RepID=A0A7X8XUI6_9BACT|nr:MULTISPECIES: NUDIX hydrolase [Flammeovirga]NLR90393.1 NUDIX hydrolase [Flammeovirga agarivorans]
MKFCSNCGSDRLQFIIPEGDHKERFVCPDCNTIHYQNPRVIAGCIPMYNGKVLLGKRAIEPRYGFWNLPAGFLECGETPEEGALRELYEETHAKGKIVRLHTIFSLPQFNQVYMLYLVDLESDYATPTSESTEVAFYDLDNIPWEDIAFESTTFTLEKLIEFPEATETFSGKFIWKEERFKH